MSKSQLLVLALIVLTGWGCSFQDNKVTYLQTDFTGELTVDSLTTSDDIYITIINKNSENGTDTLFHERTTDGELSSSVSFKNKGRYPLILSYEDGEIGQSQIILANRDTVQIKGDLSNLEETFSITSREFDALEDYQRLNKGFQRVARIISIGGLTGDSLQQEINKWSDLYWDVYEDKIGTIGSELSARESIRILEGANNEKMMKRIRTLHTDDRFIDLGLSYGVDYLANNQGLDPALKYLDSLSSFTDDKDFSSRIGIRRIKLLYDSARVDFAQKELIKFQKEFPDIPEEWVETVSYDLAYLSPGDTLPDFEFTSNGKLVSRDSMIDTPYILEITRLSNSLYQDQFDRTVVIHSLYKNFGLDIITLPLDESQVTVDAFFEERVKPWTVANAQAFDRDSLLKKFNVRRLPTRFLVDRDGRIVRKYVGREYQDVIQGIQSILNQEKQAS